MNEVQKNFKKQMKQNLRELKKNNKEEYYNYFKMNHIDDTEGRIKRESVNKVSGFIKGVIRVIITSLFLMALIIVAVVTMNNTDAKTNTSTNSNKAISINVNQKQSINSEQSKIIKYTDDIDIYRREINKDIDLRNNDLQSYKNKLLTQKEYLNNALVYKNRINLDVNKINAIEAPPELEVYKTIIIQQYRFLVKAIEEEIEYMETGNTSKHEECDAYINSCNEMMAKSSKELNLQLDKYGIKHK